MDIFECNFKLIDQNTSSMKRFIFIGLVILVSALNIFAQENTIWRNNFSWNMSDMIFQRVTFDFERINKNGKIAVIIPLSVRFGPAKSELSYSYSNLPVPLVNKMLDETDWYIGLGFLLYPLGNLNKFRFFFGPEIRYGEATHVVNSSYYDSYVDQNIEDNDEVHYSNISFLMNAGFKFYPLEQLYMGLKIAIGAYSKQNNGIDMLVSPGLKIGLNF